MSYRHLLLLVLVLAALASGCNALEQACPDGYWRASTGAACTPYPFPPDGGAAPDGSAPDGAVADGGSMDAGAADAGAADAGSADASALDAGAGADAAAGDASTAGDAAVSPGG